MTRDASIAICVDERQVTLVSRSDKGTLACASAAWDGQPTSLASALDPLIAAAPVARTASIVLRRPVANLRTIVMPNMQRSAAERVLARDGSRHVIGVRATDHTVAAVPIGRGRWRAAFAPTDLLEALAEVARAHGWTTFDVRAADDVLADAVATFARDDGGDDVIAILCDETGPTEASHVHRGAARGGRRFIANSNESDVAAFAQSSASGALITLTGDASQANALARALGAQGLRARVVGVGAPGATATTTLATLALRANGGLLLRSATMARQRARRFRTAAWWVGAAAAVALVAALAMEQRRVTASLGVIRQQRADLSGPVSNAVARRAKMQSSVDLASALAAREQEASRTSSILALVTLAQPSGTALTLLNVSGDTLTVEGESAHSASVYQSLRALPMLAQVKLSAPLRQERQAGDVAVEHFAFTARITPTGPRVVQARR